MATTPHEERPPSALAATLASTSSSSRSGAACTTAGRPRAAASASGVEKTIADTIAGRGAPAGRDTARLQRGAAVDRYVVLHELGAGGMGVVYAAYDPELDRKIALKLVLSSRRSGTESVGGQRLLREAQALAKLSHQNVVGIHDVGAIDERVWIAMEFVEGQTLSEWAKRSRRSWREVLAVMTGAGRGLAAAHASGLLHRDFKPDCTGDAPKTLQHPAAPGFVGFWRGRGFSCLAVASASTRDSALDLEPRRNVSRRVAISALPTTPARVGSGEAGDAKKRDGPARGEVTAWVAERSDMESVTATGKGRCDGHRHGASCCRSRQL